MPRGRKDVSLMTPEQMSEALERWRGKLDSLSMEDIAGLTKGDFGRPDISDGELAILKGSFELLKSGVPAETVLRVAAEYGSEKTERSFIQLCIARGAFDVGDYDVSPLIEEPKLEVLSVCHKTVRTSNRKMIEDLFMEELGKRRDGLDGMFYLLVHDRKTKGMPVGYTGGNVKLDYARTLPVANLHVVQLDGGEFVKLKPGARSWLLRHELLESIVEDNGVERQYEVKGVGVPFRLLPWYEAARNIVIDGTLMVEDPDVAEYHFSFHKKLVDQMCRAARTRTFLERDEMNGTRLMASLLTGCYLASCITPYRTASQRGDKRRGQYFDSYRYQLLGATKRLPELVGTEYQGLMRVFEENLYGVGIEGNRISDATCKRLYSGIDAFVKDL